jgi:peptidoglycan/xylan/chitin deacetylase (PgdA/CDA1 family)
MTALMYHDVVAAGDEDSSGFPGRDAALYKVTPETFAAHLVAIAQATRRPQHHTPYPPNSVDPRDPPDLILTFDDGGVSAMKAADLLDSRGFVGHFFVTTNYIGTRGFVSDADIRDLAGRGHVIGSHSCSHPLRMGHCTDAQLRDEWRRSCATLSDIVGNQVRAASVPGGDFSRPVAEAAAQAGITQLFTSEPTGEAKPVPRLTLRGRFTIQRWTTARTAAALAAGRWLPRARQAAVWNAKKLTKRLGGERYLQIRKLLIGHGDDVRWGDQG